MHLITDEYKRINQQLHKDNIKYGTIGAVYVEDIVKILQAFNTQDLLDYGCGKSTLANNLPFKIKQYDPAVPQYDELPEPADVVICTDVLEHIEPELLDNVLEHIKSLTKKMAYVTAATIEAKKTLSDGRNAHLIIKDAEWWKNKLSEHFVITNFTVNDVQIIALLKPKPQFIFIGAH